MMHEARQPWKRWIVPKSDGRGSAPGRCLPDEPVNLTGQLPKPAYDWAARRAAGGRGNRAAVLARHPFAEHRQVGARGRPKGRCQSRRGGRTLVTMSQRRQPKGGRPPIPLEPPTSTEVNATATTTDVSNIRRQRLGTCALPDPPTDVSMSQPPSLQLCRTCRTTRGKDQREERSPTPAYSGRHRPVVRTLQALCRKVSWLLLARLQFGIAPSCGPR